MARRDVHLWLPADLIQAIQDRVGERGLSNFIAEATAIHYGRLELDRVKAEVLERRNEHIAQATQTTDATAKAQHFDLSSRLWQCYTMLDNYDHAIQERVSDQIRHLEEFTETLVEAQIRPPTLWQVLQLKGTVRRTP